MKKKMINSLFALVLLLSLLLVTAAPAMAAGETLTLDMPEDIYQPAEFGLSSQCTSPDAYTNVRFEFEIDGPGEFSGTPSDYFAFTATDSALGLQGINDALVISASGTIEGYWGPADGFEMSAGYDITTTFTAQMTGTAPLGDYSVALSLVDIVDSGNPVTLADVSTAFVLSDDSLYVGTTEYEYQFTTIQSTVDAAFAGNTIIVADGTYNYESEGSPEPAGLIKIDKPITIKAADGVRPVIDGSGFDGVFKIWPSALSSGGSVTIDGFDIIGDVDTDIAITGRMDTSATAELIIQNNYIHGMNVGIDFWGTGGGQLKNVQITSNVFSDLGNTGDDEHWGIMLEDLANWTTAGDDYAAIVEQNEFSDIYDGEGDESAGIGIFIPRADGASEASNIHIVDNSFTNVPVGVKIYDYNDKGTINVSTTRISGNNFGSSATYGVAVVGEDITNGPVDAIGNWWGNASGPYHATNTNGTGISVSDNVSYDPWLGSTPDTTPMTWYTKASIQDTIDVADTGDTINVLPGTYEEAITIDKGLTLSGATSGVDKNSFTLPETLGDYDDSIESVIKTPTEDNPNAVTITSSDVTFQGFIVEALNRTATGGNNNNNLIELRPAVTADGMTDVFIKNNVVGPNMGEETPCVNGRHGIRLSAGAGSSITDTTITGNKVFGTYGNGNNIFVWGTNYYEPDSHLISDLTGTVIENNDISDSARSGIELSGAQNGGLVINNNCIYSNGTGHTGDDSDLKYGNGISFVRDYIDVGLGGYDDPGADAGFIDGVAISNNEIFNNDKNGIYFGPMNRNITITGNDIYGNGYSGRIVDQGFGDGDGFRIDLTGAYYGTGAGQLGSTSSVVAEYNNIYDNIGYGIQIVGYPTNDFELVAANNWWGHVSGPVPNTAGPNYTSYGDGAHPSEFIDFQPWLLEEVIPETNPATYDYTLALKNGWTLVSTDKVVTTGTTWVGTEVIAAEATVLALAYTADAGYEQIDATDLDAAGAVYVKTDGGGGIGLIYSTAQPGVISKDLKAGWNLISTASWSSAAAILSPLRYVQVGEEQGICLTTLVSQGAYNQFSHAYQFPALTDTDWEALTMELIPYDGYWICLNEDKSFGVIPDEWAPEK